MQDKVLRTEVTRPLGGGGEGPGPARLSRGPDLILYPGCVQGFSSVLPAVGILHSGGCRDGFILFILVPLGGLSGLLLWGVSYYLEGSKHSGL